MDRSKYVNGTRAQFGKFINSEIFNLLIYKARKTLFIVFFESQKKKKQQTTNPS